MFQWRGAEVDRAFELLCGYADEESRHKVAENEGTAWLESLSGSFCRAMFFAGFSPREINRRLLRYMILTAFLILLSLLSKKLLIMFGLPIYLLVDYCILQKKGACRARDFEKDYPALLLSLASGIRTGLDPLVALCRSAELFSQDTLLRIEIEHFNEEISRGANEDYAIRRFAAAIAHPDLSLFRSTFLLARREGSSLAECLQRLAKVTRQRQSFRRKIKSAVAMQRLSIIGIAVCTLVIAAIQCVSNFDALRNAIQHPIGSKALSFGLALIVLGFVWMMHIARTRT